MSSTSTPIDFTIDELTTEEEAAINFAEAMKLMAEPDDQPREFICFVSPTYQRKRTCRHVIQADNRSAAANLAVNDCSLSNAEEVEVEVFVHPGTMYRYELVEQKGKK